MRRFGHPVLLAFLILCGLALEPALTGAAGTGGATRQRHARPRPMLAPRRLVANGGFETGNLRPWHTSGTLPPRVVTAPRFDGRDAALVGRLTAGPAATSTMTLSVTLPPRAASARLSLDALERCTTTRPRSVLTVAWSVAGGQDATTPRLVQYRPENGGGSPARLAHGNPARFQRSDDGGPAGSPISQGSDDGGPAGSRRSQAGNDERGRAGRPSSQDRPSSAARAPALAGTLLDGCADSPAWLPISADLSGAISHTVVVTASAVVAPNEAAALILDDVQVTATLPLTPTPPVMITPTTFITVTAPLTPTLTGAITATPGLTTTPAISSTPTATPTNVPDICVSPVISAAYAAILPTFTPTTAPRPTAAPTITPTGTLTPTATAVWWHTATPTPTSTPTSGPTPGYTVTPGPSPTVGTACHPVAKGISYGFVARDGGPTAEASPVVGDADAQAVLASGARYVRIDFHLVHDDSWTPAEYGAYDAVVNTFQAQHIDVLGLVGPGVVARSYYPAAWQANSMERSGGDGDNTFLQTYAARVLDLVSHFHGRIHTWELWNEPNVGAGGTYMYPSNFAAMLADTYTLVKRAFPDVTLVSGGILSDDDAGHATPQNAGADYLRQTYYMGLEVTHAWDAVRQEFGSDPLDAIGQHLYLDQGSLVYTQHIVDAYRWMHDAYAAFGDGAKPIYVTEAAWSTSAVSLPQQALNLDMLYSMSQNPVVPYVARVYWYLLRDGHDPSQAYGLQAHDGSAKQAYYRYLAY